MVWSSSPTRNRSSAGLVSNRASRHWAWSRSWTSSTSRVAHRSRHRSRRARLIRQQADGLDDEVVVIHRAALGEQPLVGVQDPGWRGPGLRFQLGPGDGVVEPSQRRRSQPLAGHVPEHRQPVHHPPVRAAGVEQDLPPEGMEGPHADGVRRQALLGDQRREARPQVGRRAAVERHARRSDPARRPVGQAPRQAGDERGRLAAPGRRDAQDGPGPARSRRPAGPAPATRAARAGGRGWPWVGDGGRRHFAAVAARARVGGYHRRDERHHGGPGSAAGRGGRPPGRPGPRGAGGRRQHHAPRSP